MQFLVQILIQLKEYMDSIKNNNQLCSIDDEAEQSLLISLGEKEIENIVTDISTSDYSELYEFAYHLVKADVQDMYTYDFISGNV